MMSEYFSKRTSFYKRVQPTLKRKFSKALRQHETRRGNEVE